MDWGRIFFSLHHYCHLTEAEIISLSLPKLKIYLEYIKEQVEYEIKIHGGEVATARKATLGDIKNLFGWANAKKKRK